MVPTFLNSLESQITTLTGLQSTAGGNLKPDHISYTIIDSHNNPEYMHVLVNAG